MTGQRWASALIMLAMATVTAGCVADRVVLPTPSPTAVAGPVTCDGTSGQPLLAELFADLARGEPTPVGRFFSAPKDFLRWEDPTTGTDITPGFGADTSTYTLDALQSHLDELALAGVAGTITHFAIDGDPRGDGKDPGGGLFRFDLRARWHGGDPEADEGGIGMIDCATGRLKEVAITG
jgi:hypothetical protein